jgi:UDPglucose--hexose-1-phosphate uridylyltransferase
MICGGAFMPELRRDPIIGRWVIISAERGARPSDFKTFARESEEDKATCPFCPGNEETTPSEIMAYHPPGRKKDTQGWWVRVIPNKYPALEKGENVFRCGEGMYDKMNGIGTHEIIIETPKHVDYFADMHDQEVKDIIYAYRDRIVELKKNPQFKYTLVFKNHGKSAGATKRHPHSQLITLPMVPIRVSQEMEGAKKYFDYKERCVFCDILREELSQQKRIVGENDSFLSVTPYASRFAYETWIIPKKHSDEFENISDVEVTDFAQMIKLVFGKYRKVLNDFAYNFIIHSAPFRKGGTVYYHWHMEIMPKMSYLAGFETGTGFYINSVSPETAAQKLNEDNQS